MHETMSSTRRTGLASVPERVLLLLNSGLGHRGLSVAVAALSRFVVAKSVLGRPVVVEGRGASSCRAHAFAVCVVEQSTGQLQFATEFTTDTDAVLAALAGVSLPVTIGSAGDGTPGVGNAVDVSPTALDLSQLLVSLKPFGFDRNISSLLHVVCVYGSSVRPAAPTFSAGAQTCTWMCSDTLLCVRSALFARLVHGYV